METASKKTESASHVRVIEETSAYWRVLFDNPPFNIVDATIFEGLQDLLARMDASPNLRVVVFESANPEFYLAHFDLTGKTGNITTAVGPSGLPILMDTFVRLTKSPVVSIAKIRGCVRGVSSEFVLACDMRFASRENTLLGQPEVGVGVNPGGGGTERLPLLVGRGRALEIVLGARDFEATPRNDMDTSTVHFRTRSWTASSTCSRAGSPPSIGVLSRRRRISLTKSRCHTQTGSSMPSTPFRQRLRGLKRNSESKLC
jgi:1,4-dihydroxy-2-naphthoyl-CoA synthase